MASIEELKEALKDTLENRGVINELKARIRSEIFHALDSSSQVPKPRPSNENLLINELIREYLEFNGYLHTLSVFIPESGQPEQPPFDRAFLSKEFRVVESQDSKDLPLLYGLVHGLQSGDIQPSKENDQQSQYLAPGNQIQPQPFILNK